MPRPPSKNLRDPPSEEDPPLALLIVEEQMRRLQREINVLQGRSPYAHPTPGDALGQSRYVSHTKVNSGPKYMRVMASVWFSGVHTPHGNAKNLEKARRIAKKHGFQGIRIVFPSEPGYGQF